PTAGSGLLTANRSHATRSAGADQSLKSARSCPRNGEHLSQSPHALAELHLMREACRLLAYTRMTAQQVAFQLGYQDPSYFNRRFRNAFGVSPGGYRRRLEEGQQGAAR
ncbi:AraC family transcriptional regulator, partial [Paracoccus sp. PAMC 22219]|uniref:helix-turn-helix domain-containing protein n=1 Tax=Paracoccus sp. PAMC 22219 TaxID=1569209 RepID=UPI0012E01F1D